MQHVLLKKVTIQDPSSPFYLKRKDILISKGIIVDIGSDITSKNAHIISGKDLFVSIGFCDIFAQFCEPGSEHKENLQSGTAAAAAGGYTDVCIVPNTAPALDDKSSIAYIKNSSNLVNLHPIGAASKQLLGKELAEMYDMRAAGAVAFGDGKKPIQDSGLMLKALEYLKTYHCVLITLPISNSLASHGLMHEGATSTQLGLQGVPAIAETIQLQRDIELLRYTQSKLHVAGITCQRSVELIREAKRNGLQISCSVSPWHLLYTDAMLEEYNSLFKLDMPLRSEQDRKALIKGVKDGTIDCIASHHTPQDWDAKQTEFEYAAEGMIALQAMLPTLLLLNKELDFHTHLLPMLTSKPRSILGLPVNSIEKGAVANLTLYSLSHQWTYDEVSNKSKANNSPLFQSTLNGKVLATVNNNHISTYE